MKQLPAFLKKYFWEIDFDRLNPEKSPYYIIKRILNYGDKRATGWLFRNFDRKAMIYSLQNHRGYTKRATTYWGNFFHMRRSSIMYFKKGFPNPPIRLWPY